MHSFLQDILQSIAIKDALILLIVAIIAFGPRILDYFTHRLSNRARRETLRTDADKQQLELDQERDRHSRESSNTKMRLIELQLTEISGHNENLMALVHKLQQTNAALVTDNRKLHARMQNLERQVAQFRPLLQELTKLRKRTTGQAVQIAQLRQQLQPKDNP